jgi:isopenicillin-N epimerase
VDRYRLLFDWLGTDDFSAWAVIPDVLRLVGDLDPGGWDAIMKHNHELVLEGRRTMLEALGVPPSAPNAMVGSMASIPLPDRDGPNPGGELSPLMDELIDLGFATLVMNWPTWPQQLIRISAYLYNTASEYRDLAGVLRT